MISHFDISRSQTQLPAFTLNESSESL